MCHFKHLRSLIIADEGIGTVVFFIFKLLVEIDNESQASGDRDKRMKNYEWMNDNFGK